MNKVDFMNAKRVLNEIKSGEFKTRCEADSELIVDAFEPLIQELEQRLEAGQHETIVNCPEPFTAEFLAYLLVNALRHLNEAQRHNLALSLAVRDPLFSIEEYEKQLGN